MTSRLSVALLLSVACGGPPDTRGDGPAPRPLPPCPPVWTGAADLHVDLPYQVAFRDRSVDLDEPGVDVTSATLRAGNVRMLVLSLYLPSKQRDATLEDLEGLLETTESVVDRNRALFDELDASVVFGVEGSRALAGQFDRVPSLILRRVVLFGLTHRYHNALADSSQDRSPGSGGLSEKGETFVRAVFAAGGIIDVSHASDAAVRGAVDIALAVGGVVVATHSNARAVANHERNLPDDLLRAIAGTGGLVGLNFHSRFLREEGATRIDDVLDHATHMIDVMGADHVAIGSDFDGNIRPPRDLKTHADLPALAAGLRARGIGDGEVSAIMGGNAYRVIARPLTPPSCDAGGEPRRSPPKRTGPSR